MSHHNNYCYYFATSIMSCFFDSIAVFSFHFLWLFVVVLTTMTVKNKKNKKLDEKTELSKYFMWWIKYFLWFKSLKFPQLILVFSCHRKPHEMNFLQGNSHLIFAFSRPRCNFPFISSPNSAKINCEILMNSQSFSCPLKDNKIAMKRRNWLLIHQNFISSTIIVFRLHVPQ